MSALTEPQAPKPPEAWSRRQFLLTAGGLFVFGATAVFGAQPAVKAWRSVFGSPVSSGLINVYQFDYYFVPNYMTWRVGDHNTIFLQNMSTTRWHEMQIGRHPSYVETQLGKLTADGFLEDFWKGVPVTLSDPYRIDNFTYADDQHPVYKGAPKSDFVIVGGGGFSPTLKPGGHIKIDFVVPDKPGLWEYACFVQHQAHFRLGMRGLLNILPA